MLTQESCEGAAYAAALSEAGVPTRRDPGASLIHGCFGLGEASATARADFKSRCSGAAREGAEVAAFPQCTIFSKLDRALIPSSNRTPFGFRERTS